jgi:uncharacterized MAPEG superfamily protein
MGVPLLCLLGFAAWAILLVLAIGTARTTQVLRGEKRSNEFPSGMQHGGELYWRLNRAHVNTVENLAVFATLVLVGTAVHVSTPAFERLPEVVLGARIVQSLVHISSGSPRAVNVRFTAFVVQLVCFGWMLLEILRTAG